MTPRASVVIPHHAGSAMLGECLAAVAGTTPPGTKVIVVDNASAERPRERLAAAHPEVVWVESDCNRGFAGGANLGARTARGAVLVFLNDDTLPEPGWLERLLARLDVTPRAAAAQAKLVDAGEPGRFDYAGGAGGYLDWLGFPFVRGRVFETRERDRGQYDRAVPVFWGCAAALVVRREAFEAAGGFDETFFAHMEEVDLCWRLHLLGHEVWAEPAAVVRHRNAATLPKGSARKHFLNHRNSLLMLCANLPGGALAAALPLRLALEAVALGYALALRDGAHARGILRAQAWLWCHPGRVLAKRRAVAPLRRAGARPPLHPRSAVLAHFVRRRDTCAAIRPEGGAR